MKEVADRLQEKIQLLKSEVKLREKIQKIMRRTQLLLKTQVADRETGGQADCLFVCLSDWLCLCLKQVDASNQQYSQISRRLDRLKTEMEDGQVPRLPVYYCLL